jgi:exopolysaccharide production protein ExoY
VTAAANYLRSVQLPSVITRASIQNASAPLKADIWRVITVGEKACAGLALILCLPAIVFAGIVVCGLSGRSPLIAHKRVGFRGRSIWVLKLRTMWETRKGFDWRLVERLDPPQPEDVVPKLVTDRRVTSLFALFCRRFSIDELPQLWQVVCGEMALVGPRPLTQHELAAHYGPDACEILTRKPGLSGLWQVRGRSRLSYDQRRQFDLFLVRRWSIGLYLQILGATVFNVLSGKDAW